MTINSFLPAVLAGKWAKKDVFYVSVHRESNVFFANNSI